MERLLGREVSSHGNNKWFARVKVLLDERGKNARDRGSEIDAAVPRVQKQHGRGSRVR